MALGKATLLVIGIALTLIALQSFDMQATLQVLYGTRLDVLALIIILQAAALGLWGFRLKVLSYGKGYLPYWQSLRIAMAGMFVSMITPLAKLGGEPLKIYMLRKNIGSNHASAVIAVESITELLSSILVVVAVMAVFFNRIPASLISSFVIFLVLITVAFAIFLKVLFTPKWMRRIISWSADRLARSQQAEKKDYVKLFYDAFGNMWKDKKVFYGSFAISVLIKIIEIVRLWLVFVAIGSPLPLSNVVIVWTMILVLLFVPWLPGSLVLVEFGAASAFVLFGATPSAAAAGIILDRLVSFWLVLFIGFMAISSVRTSDGLPAIGKGKNAKAIGRETNPIEDMAQK